MATFVLVHGGIMGGWAWKGVVPPLRAAGHEIYAPTLTGCGERVHLASPEVGLETHIQDIVNVLMYEDLRDVILVGHSYAGMVITGVAGRVPDCLAKLVYLDAMFPRSGQSAIDVWRESGGQHDFLVWLEENVRTQGDGWKVPTMPPQEYGVTDEADVRWAAAKATPHPYKTFVDPVYYDEAAFQSIPRIGIRCIGDQPPPLDEVGPGGAPMLFIATGHAANIAAPRELAELLLTLV